MRVYDAIYLPEDICENPRTVKTQKMKSIMIPKELYVQDVRYNNEIVSTWQRDDRDKPLCQKLSL